MRDEDESVREAATWAEQEEFRQHLRRLAVNAVQVLMEQIMLEELEQCIGAHVQGNALPRVVAIAMGSTPVISSPPRGGLKISKWEDDREGEFHTQAFERYSRRAQLTQQFFPGTLPQCDQRYGERH